MKQRINDLSREEIARRFPVEVVPYDAQWPALFESEKALIINALGDGLALRVEHFGSTSIPGLPAKPTIDILVEIPAGDEWKEEIIAKLTVQDYDFMWQTDSDPPYMVFAKGYNLTGPKEQTYHIHMGTKAHALWDRLYFRDYLREHPSVAREYETLKYELADTYKYDRVGYRIAKTDFVKAITETAKAHYNQ